MNAAAESSASANGSAHVIVSAPATTVTPTSRPIRPRRPSPATPLPPPPAQTVPDSRDDLPETCKDSYILRDALEETVEHFKKLTGQNPKPTSIGESYSSQWNALQAHFVPIWKSQRPAEETPLLFKLDAWTGGIDCWDHNWQGQVGGKKRDREGEIFGEYMDATQDGTAYLGRDGTWRSVRDTWCNSHLNHNEIEWDRRESTGEEVSEETSEEEPEQRPEVDCMVDSEEGSDDEFNDTL